MKLIHLLGETCFKVFMKHCVLSSILFVKENREQLKPYEKNTS